MILMWWATAHATSMNFTFCPYRSWGRDVCAVAPVDAAPCRRGLLGSDAAREPRKARCEVCDEAFAMAIDGIPGPRTLSTVAQLAGARSGPDGAVRIGGVAPTVIVDGVPVVDDWMTSGGRTPPLGLLGAAAVGTVGGPGLAPAVGIVGGL